MPSKYRKTIDADRVREVLRYDKLSGLFTWRIDRGTARAGSVAGTRLNSGRGYVHVGIDGHQYLAHRLAFLYVTGAVPDIVDHINGDGMDNHYTNLRAATHKDNMRHLTKIPKNNTSGHIGVCWDKHANKWYAGISVNDKSINLGRYANINDAIAARKAGQERYFGTFSPEVTGKVLLRLP